MILQGVKDIYKGRGEKKAYESAESMKRYHTTHTQSEMVNTWTTDHETSVKN